MHEREGAEQGLRYLYRLIDLDALGLPANALPDLLIAAERMGYSGLNITHPCKQSVMPLLHELSPDALAIGAVNTVLLRAGKRIGHNTDWWGFAESFRRGMPDVARERVVLLGAGGAGAAVGYAVMTLGVHHLTVIDVDVPRAVQLVQRLNAHFGAGRVAAGNDAAVAMTEANGLIHATPIGMHSHPGLPLSEALLRRDLWVAEIVYFPLETALLKCAAARGCRTLNGAGMAVFQAVEAFRLFTGITPDSARMLRHFDGMDVN
jgi:shikimate dehydrogenase